MTSHIRISLRGFALLAIIALTAGTAAAQIEIIDTTNPFRDFDRSNLANIGTNNNTPPQLTLPAAMAVENRPLVLLPPRPVIDTKSKAAGDAELQTLRTRRSEVLKQMKAARRRGDQKAVMGLARQLEELRQARFGRLRKIAPTGAPKPATDPAVAGEGGEKPATPILPIPKAPKK